MSYIQLNSDRLGEYSGIWVSGICIEDIEDMIDAFLIIIKNGYLGKSWEIANIDGRPVLQRIKI